MTKIKLQFKTLADAEVYLMAQGFELAPAGGCDWINAAGDDAGCYPIEREPYGAVEGFRVEINRKA
jgi:hypothetical protein